MLFVDREQRFAVPLLADAVDLAAVNAAGLQDVTDSTLRWWRSAFDRLGRWCAPGLRLDELDAQTLYDWHREIAGGASAVTANSYLRAVATVMARLVRAGILADSPARYVEYLPEPATDPKAIEEATYRAMRAAASCARDVALIDVLWSTGCRLAGLLSMRVDRIEFWRDGDELRMAAVVVEKFGKARHVYARPPQSVSILSWYNDRPALPHPALFVSIGSRSYGQPLRPGGVQSVLRGLRLAAGIPPGTAANAHSFRHGFAIRMLDRGHDLAAVAAWLGHTDPAFTAKTYARRREKELRRKFFEKI